MKRYSLLEDRFKGAKALLETFDGEWIRYADHCEAMKRIAGGGVDAAAFIERKADDYAREFGSNDMGSLSFGNEDMRIYHWHLVELADEIRALAAPSASAQQAEPLPACRPGRWRDGDACEPAAPAPTQGTQEPVALTDERIIEVARPWFGGLADNLRLNLIEFARELLAAPAPSAAPAAPLSDQRIKAIADGLFDHQRFTDKTPPMDRDGFREIIGSAIAEWAAASPAEQGEDARDAARYRWLRDSDRLPDEIDGEIVVGSAGGEDLLFDNALDIAIDAAMSATPPAGER